MSNVLQHEKLSFERKIYYVEMDVNSDRQVRNEKLKANFTNIRL